MSAQQQEKMAQKFYIILLADGLVLVPSNWLTPDHQLCYWPAKYGKPRVDTAIQNMETPQISKDWPLFKVIQIYGSAATFQRGMQKLKKCEYISYLDSGNTSVDADDDDDDEIPKQTRQNQSNSKISLRQSAEEKRTQINKGQASSSKLSNVTLASFPNPPRTLTTIQEHDHDSQGYLNQNYLRIGTGSEKTPVSVSEKHKSPVVLATFESPIINEDQPSYNCDTSHPRFTLSPERIDHNENLLLQNTPTQGKSHVPQRIAVPTIDQIQDKEFKKDVLKKLNKLISELAILKESVEALKIETNVNEANVIEHEEVKNLPLRTSHQLEQLEAKLEDQVVLQQLVKTLCSIGGHDTNNITTNVMKKLISNPLAEQYSLLGKKNKKPFNKLKLMRAVIGAVRFHDKDATESNIEKYVGRWLVQAKQRNDREMQSVQRRNHVPVTIQQLL